MQLKNCTKKIIIKLINSSKNKLKTLISFNFRHFPNTLRKASSGGYLLKGKTKSKWLEAKGFSQTEEA